MQKCKLDTKESLLFSKKNCRSKFLDQNSKFKLRPFLATQNVNIEVFAGKTSLFENSLRSQFCNVRLSLATNFTDNVSFATVAQLE